VVVLVASDDPSDLADEVARIEESVYTGRTAEGEFGVSGVQILFKQNCAVLPRPLTGHEHFGFLDGVSQPGLRGRLSDDETDVLTLRQNPNDPDQGKPGQDLLWPGEFVFGYPQQIGEPKMGDDGPLEGVNPDPGPVAEAGPVWAKDGSYVVIRRLRQDVGAFREFISESASRLGVSGERLAAQLVGRWKSGAPFLRATDSDIPALGFDDCANNHFEFQDASESIEPVPDPTDPTCVEESALCVDVKFPVSQGDPQGANCPFASHVRKTYPRDDEGDGLQNINEADTQTHRLLRRGIPFGEPYYPPAEAGRRSDAGNRGLMFVAYQTSIVRQFEFVIRNWVNNPNFKDKATAGGEVISGHDMIIGQSNGKRESRERVCPVTVTGPDGEPRREELRSQTDWVIPTGGGYFFSPSIEALCLLTGTDHS
jgi:Dyp-type peroxidase family